MAAPHTLVTGVTKCGKTTLCKQLAADFKARGKKVALCDILPPEFRRGWKYDVFVPPELLGRFIVEKRDYVIFCDEASDYIGHDPAMQQIVKKAANYGHYLFIISQRARMVHPSTRGQCSTLITFRQSRNDGRILTDEFCREGLDPEEIVRLAPGSYLYSPGPGSPAHLCKVF